MKTGEDNPLQQTSLFIDVAPGHRLHMRRITAHGSGPALLLLHGAVANARTFYSESGRGLGPWLAARGFDVFALDLRGRGRSTPAIARGARHGQYEAINEDIPAAIAYIEQLRGKDVPLGLMAHSWGGVLLTAMLARHPALARRVSACVYFGSKRSIQVKNWPKRIEIDLFWLRLASLCAGVAGYLPARGLGIGADSETRLALRQSQRWVQSLRWHDEDGFDYAAALADGGLPPILYLAGSADRVRGHPDDVARFIAECGPHTHEQCFLGRSSGLQHDYGHLDMLTGRHAPQEVFPMAEQWLRRHMAV
ncbi:alpha/beta fold hydrolase [Chitinimonas sp.]|uniref:alpha/beta fold hydrolase n=1 Tax=Chitinimonas sp. TaxID=1934313 RepID=UPI0035AEBCE9